MLVLVPVPVGNFSAKIIVLCLSEDCFDCHPYRDKSKWRVLGQWPCKQSAVAHCALHKCKQKCCGTLCTIANTVHNCKHCVQLETKCWCTHAFEEEKCATTANPWQCASLPTSVVALKPPLAPGKLAVLVLSSFLRQDQFSLLHIATWQSLYKWISS